MWIEFFFKWTSSVACTVKASMISRSKCLNTFPAWWNTQPESLESSITPNLQGEKRTWHQVDYQTEPSAFHLVLMRTRHLDSTCVILFELVQLCVCWCVNYTLLCVHQLHVAKRFITCSLEWLLHKQLCWGHWFKWQNPVTPSNAHIHTQTWLHTSSVRKEDICRGWRLEKKPNRTLVPHTHIDTLNFKSFSFVVISGLSHFSVIHGAFSLSVSGSIHVVKEDIVTWGYQASVVSSPSIKVATPKCVCLHLSLHLNSNAGLI